MLRERVAMPMLFCAPSSPSRLLPIARPAASWRRPPPRCRRRLGGKRNWDYRFCWLRDATFTLFALMDAGFTREAADWRAGWLRRAVAGDPAQVQIMYGLAGERRLTSGKCPGSPGYEGAKPVRIGNAAAKQLQLDIYGEVMDALFQRDATRSHGSRASAWPLQCKLSSTSKPYGGARRGLWEVRGGRHQFTHSKVMAWVAVDRAIKSVEQFGFEGPVAAGASYAGANPPPGVHRKATMPNSAPSCSATVQPSLMPAPCLSRWWAFCRLPIRVFAPRSRPSAASLMEMVSSCRYDTRAGRMGLRAAKALSWPAAFGMPTTSSCLAGVRRPKNSSSICWPAQRCRSAGRGIRYRGPGAWSGIFRRHSPMWPL